MEATEKIKLVADGKTRKINVERRNALKSIASIVGKPSSFTYVDSDEDEIICLTDEEVSCAIFEDSVTKFAAVFTDKESSESSDIRQPRALHELTNIESEATTSPRDEEARQNQDRFTNKSSRNVLDNAGATTNSTNSSIEDAAGVSESQPTAVSSKSGKPDSSLDKFLPQLRKEHSKVYGMDCAFSVTNGKRNGLLPCLHACCKQHSGMC